jgi:hypothetical protein
MPHYPDDIEYSDKYMDDHYEYRHVILPRDVYKKAPRSRLLTESVCKYSNVRNGEDWVYNKVEDGCIIKFINLSLISYFFAGLKEQIHKLDYLLLDLLLLLTVSPIDHASNIYIYLLIFALFFC